MILELSHINIEANNWGCYFRQFLEFTDTRLAFDAREIAPRKALALFPRFKGRLWEPEETWTNQVKLVGPIRETYYIFTGGRCKLKSHFHGSFMFTSDMSMFPFDRQWLDMSIKLTGTDDSQVQLDFQRPSSMVLKDTAVGEYSIVAMDPKRNSTKYINVQPGIGGKTKAKAKSLFISELTFSIHVQRPVNVWFIRFFLPLMLLFAVAYGTFFINPRSGMRSPICIYTFTCTIYYYMMLVAVMPFSGNGTFMAVYMIISLVIVSWAEFAFVMVAVASRPGGSYDDIIANLEAENMPAGTAPKVKERARRRSVTFQTPLERGSRKANALKIDIWSRQYFPLVVILVNVIASLWVATYTTRLMDWLSETPYIGKDGQ